MDILLLAENSTITRVHCIKYILIFCHDQIKSIYNTFFIVISKNNYFSMKKRQKTHSCGTITTQVCNSKKENNDVLPPSTPKGTMDRQKEFRTIYCVLIQGYSNSPDSNNAVLDIMWFAICTNLSIMYSLIECTFWKHSYELIELLSETLSAIAPMLACQWYKFSMLHQRGAITRTSL